MNNYKPTFDHPCVWVHTYTRILFSHKKGELAVCDNMDVLEGHYAKWNKPDREDKYCMVSFICET